MSNEVHLRDRESQTSFIKDQKEDTRDYTLMSLADITQEAEGSCTKEENIYQSQGPVFRKQELGSMVLSQLARESCSDSGSNPLH